MFALTRKASGATVFTAALIASVMTMAATASWADRHGDRRGGESRETYQSWRNGGSRGNNGGASHDQNWGGNGGQRGSGGSRGNWGGNGGQTHDRNWSGGGQRGSWGGGSRGNWGGSGGASHERGWSGGGARGGWSGGPSYRSWSGGGVTYRRSYGGGGYYRRGGWGGSRYYYRPRTIIRLGFGFGDPYYYGYDPYVVEPAPVIVRQAPTVIEDPGTSFDVTNEPPAGCYYYDSESDQRFSTLDDYTDFLMQNRGHSRTCEIVREDSGETIHTLVFDGDVWRVQN